MRVLVVVNTRSGGSDAGLYDYARALGAGGVEVVMRFVSPTARLEDLVADSGAFDRVVAAGGDGTVSAVCYAMRHSGVPVLVYPAGTANLLALNLGLPLDAPALARITLEGTPVSFDLGELHHTDINGVIRSSGFAVMAGAGYDAAIMESAAPLKATFGAAAYLMAAVGNIAPTVSYFEILIDGTSVTTDGIAVLLVNFGRIQFDLTITQGWDPRDGLLDVVVVTAKHTAALLPAVFAAVLDRVAGNADRSSGLEVYRAGQVEVHATPDLRMQYDGEVLDEVTPFSARSLPRAATLMVPQGSPFAEKP